MPPDGCGTRRKQVPRRPPWAISAMPRCYLPVPVAPRGERIARHQVKLANEKARPRPDRMNSGECDRRVLIVVGLEEVALQFTVCPLRDDDVDRHARSRNQCATCATAPAALSTLGFQRFARSEIWITSRPLHPTRCSAGPRAAIGSRQHWLRVEGVDRRERVVEGDDEDQIDDLWRPLRTEIMRLPSRSRRRSRRARPRPRTRARARRSRWRLMR